MDLVAPADVESVDEAKGIIANLQKTWSAATKVVRTSKKFVYALQALHNGYPDLMSRELFEDHLACLGSLFKNFAWQQPGREPIQ